MNDKQRYYASLERQKAVETSLRQQVADPNESGTAADDLYLDVGLRTLAAFQNCLDWLASLGRRSQQPTGAHPLGESDVGPVELAEALADIKAQLDRLEVATGNLEAGLRRIDKYTLDAFRQLTESEIARSQITEAASEAPGGRRLAREEAISLAIEAAQRMRDAGQSISLASVAREAGLKYGQIVYAFGNKSNFLNQLASIQDGPKSGSEDSEVAVANDVAI